MPFHCLYLPFSVMTGQPLLVWKTFFRKVSFRKQTIRFRLTPCHCSQHTMNLPFRKQLAYISPVPAFDRSNRLGTLSYSKFSTHYFQAANNLSMVDSTPDDAPDDAPSDTPTQTPIAPHFPGQTYRDRATNFQFRRLRRLRQRTEQ